MPATTWPEFFPTRGREAKKSPEIKYTLPFEWGNLHVTKAADTAYGLMPVTDVVVNGHQQLAINNATDAELPPINIMLAGPWERPNSIKFYPDDVGMLTWATKIKDPVNISYRVGSSQTVEGCVRQVMAEPEKLTGLDLDELERELVLRHDMGLEEGVAWLTQQELLHKMQAVLYNAIAAEARNRKLKEFNNHHKNLIVAGAAAMGLSVAILFTPGTAVPERFVNVQRVVGGTIGVWGVSSLGYIFQNHANKFPDKINEVMASSYQMGEKVADDFHDAYCSQAKDEVTSLWLVEPDDD
jgi:hypothetical protein